MFSGKYREGASCPRNASRGEVRKAGKHKGDRLRKDRCRGRNRLNRTEEEKEKA
ncbi:rCG43392 [Rattus norvegicus]|uniref:RCG43392 n=1 Tax=Rattus norvegicus TaxID=10116 RepID=A6MGR2_RAT|nr:rCG43392 [Rattus norvegicus]